MLRPDRSRIFAPLLPWCDGKAPVARVTGILGQSCFSGSSQMGCFLLPVYALSLALVLSGVSAVAERGWRAASVACTVTILVFLSLRGNV